jgi:hypothetical protein
MYNNIDGNDNIALGNWALVSNTSGNNNTGFGQTVLNQNTTGICNTCIGYSALYKNTIGNYNIGFGYKTLFNNDSGSNNIALGNECDNQNYSNTICIGNNTIANGDDQIILGTNQVISGVPFQTVYVVNAIQITSDEKKKYDIIDTPLGLEFINNLRPVDYKLKEENKPIVHHGLIAQELDKLIKEMNYNFGGIKNNNDNYTIGYTELIAPLIKAVQELTVKNKELSEQTELIVPMIQSIHELTIKNKELSEQNIEYGKRINKLENKLF